jgi:hypothetical protein
VCKEGESGERERKMPLSVCNGTGGKGTEEIAVSERAKHRES